jgi:hypothetical protein
MFGNQGDHDGLGSRKFRGIEERARKRLRWLEGRHKSYRSGAIRCRTTKHSDQWPLAICFTWRDGNAHEVEIVDYH